MDDPSNVNEPFINAEEAAEYLGVAKQTIHNKVSRGELPHYKRDGLLRFRRSELDAWLSGEDAVSEVPVA